MTRIYRYVLAHDYGMAPCPSGGRITLGTCKPVIHRCARAGDWVAGFRPGSLERGLMLWAGKVAAIMDHGRYQQLFPARPDAVYQAKADGYVRLQPGYHPTDAEMARDLSAPVLLFDPASSVYLDGVAECLPLALQHLAPAGRGHRVSCVRPDDVVDFENWIALLRQSQGEETKGTSPTIRCGKPRSAEACAPRC